MSKNTNHKIDILAIPNCRSNQNIPSVEAGIIAAHCDCPVVDFNTLQGKEDERLAAIKGKRVGLSVPARAVTEAEKIAETFNSCGASWVGSVGGAFDILCCYPFTQLKSHIDLGLPFGDVMGFPDYEHFDTIELFRENWSSGKWFYPLITSLGCPFNCTYCASRRRPQRFRSAVHCLQELQRAQELWGIKRVVVIDDCFNGDTDHACQCVEAIGSLDIEWMAGNGLRADRFDEQFASALRDSGCRWVSFGVESTSDAILKLVKKGERFEQIDRSIRIACRYFDHVNVFLILGLPGSSYELDRESIQWAKDRGVGLHVSLYVPFDQGIQYDTLFDNPENRILPDGYEKSQMLSLYQWARS